MLQCMCSSCAAAVEHWPEKLAQSMEIELYRRGAVAAAAAHTIYSTAAMVLLYYDVVVLVRSGSIARMISAEDELFYSVYTISVISGRERERGSIVPTEKLNRACVQLGYYYYIGTRAREGD